MSIKLKGCIIIIGLFLFYGIVDFGIQRFIIFPSFLSLEKEDAIRNSTRVHQAIKREIDLIDVLAHDWSAWDDTYEFVESFSSDYIEANIIDSFTDSLDLIYICDKNGKVIWGEIHDPKKESKIFIDNIPKNRLPKTHPLISYKAENKPLFDVSVTGVYITQKGPMIIASRPIVNSMSEGPIRGSLILGRFLTEQIAKNIAKQTQIDVQIFPLQKNPIPENLRGTFTQLTDNALYLIETDKDNDQKHIYTTYPDIKGHSALLIKSKIPKDIIDKGISTMQYAMLSVLLAGLGLLLVFLLALRWMILTPISRLTNHTMEIQKTGNLSKQLSYQCQDEIGVLAGAFDNMVVQLRGRSVELEGLNIKLKEDIDKRRKVEKELRESEGRFKSMMEAMNEPSYICTSDFRISYMNPAMIKKIGRDVIGEVCYKTINDLDDLCPFCVHDKVQQGESCETEISSPRDGRVYLTSHSPIFHQDGSISKMTIYRDVTDLKQTEKELALQNQINLSFSEISKTLISSSSISEICNIVFKYAIKLTGSQFGYVGYIDPATGFLVCPTMTLEIWEDCQIANKQAIFENFTGLFGWVLKEGKPLLSNDPETDPRSSGSPAGHLPIDKFLCVPALFGEDVLGQIALANPGRDYIDEDLHLLNRLAAILATAIQSWLAEEQLRKAKIEADTASQSKTTFLSSMSHELRTPLNAILGFAQLMSKDQAMPARHHEKLNIIRKSGRLLLDLINQVLDLSKIEAGQIFLDENDFDFYCQLDDLNDMFHPMAEEKGLELLFECAPDVPRNFVADEMKLRQVLINLLINAVKFTRTGSVSLKVKQAEASENHPPSSQVFLHFTVEDTGPGLRPDEIENLFKAFIQTESGRKSNKGTGLGLPISQRFVQLMGDDITISSETGRGSAFSFCIPVRVSEPSAAETKEQYRPTKGIDTNGKFDQARLKAAVEALPVQLVSELREAATYCEVDVITRIISNIREQDSELADKLDQLADQFNFDGILELLRVRA